MPNALVRILLGFIAAGLSVLTFHAAAWEALHVLNLPGYGMPPPYPMAPVPPFGIPTILSLCFWGGLYGAVFGLVAPHLRMSLHRSGVLLGVVAVVVSASLVSAVKHQAPWFNGSLNDWVISLLINCVWGLGVGVIFDLLTPERQQVESADF